MQKICFWFFVFYSYNQNNYFSEYSRMMILVGILVSIIVFSLIVLVHEYGHFKTARIFWVKVEEFWLWIPPKARRLFTDKHGTQYTLNWLPLWGFVRLKGENIQTFELYDAHKKLLNNEEIESKIINSQQIFDRQGNLVETMFYEEILSKLRENTSKDSLLTKPYYQQAIIVLAGIFMNFLLAWIIFSILFFVWVWPIGINNKIDTSLPLKIIPTQEQAIKEWILKIHSGVYLIPTEKSIAENSGILPYDLAIKVNNEEISGYENLREIISKNPQKEISISVKRALNCDITLKTDCTFEEKTIKIIPNNEGKIGAYLAENIEINRDFRYKYWPLESVKYAAIETYSQILLTFKWINILIQKIFAPETPKERQEAIKQVSGPIWVVDFITKSIGNGVIFILIIGAIISINLWVFNLLPIPALDGGRFLFILINGSVQKIFWKKAINEKFEGTLHIMFFIFLIALSAIIAYNDINKIFDN